MLRQAKKKSSSQRIATPKHENKRFSRSYTTARTVARKRSSRVQAQKTNAATFSSTIQPVVTTSPLVAIPPNQPHIHRVLIVGGGAGGLALATHLGRKLPKKDAEVMLVSRTLTHCWKPLYHELAVGSLNSYEDELNYFGHGAKNNFQFVLGSLDRIDPKKKLVHLAPLHSSDAAEHVKFAQLQHDELIAPERTVSYDTLVVSTGSKCNDFGTPGAQDHCVFLDSREEADRFQKSLISAYLKAQGQAVLLNHGDFLDKPLPGGEKVNIIAVGGGLTGIELVSELSYVVHTIAKYGLRTIDPYNVNITLVEAGPRILPALDEDIAHEVYNKLIGMGITVRTNTKVVRVEKEKMICEQDGIQTDIPFILSAWCAGIKADETLKTNGGGLETNRLNQLIVKKNLRTTVDPNIFAIGDCSSFTPSGEKRPLPASAQVAHQQAQFLYKAIPLHVKNYNNNTGPREDDDFLGEFKFQDRGVLISLAKTAVGQVFGKFRVRHWIAGLMYYSMYRFHQIELHGIKAIFWVWKDIIAQLRGKPTVKLH